MNKVKKWVGTIALAGPSLVLLLAVACGSESPDGTAVADSATAESRAQAIAQFTTEPPTATAIPAATPTAEPTARMIPTVKPKPTVVSDADREAIKLLFVRRDQAINEIDSDGFYANISPTTRELARSKNEFESVYVQLGVSGIKLPENGPVTVISNEFIFQGSHRAIVIWDFQSGLGYYASAGSTPVKKEGDEWFMTF